MRDGISAYYEAKTTTGEYEAIAKAFADDPNMEDFDVSYSLNMTIISSTGLVDDTEPCEEKIVGILNASGSPTVFAANLDPPDGPMYGLVSSDGWEAFDVQEHLRKLASVKTETLRRTNGDSPSP